MNKLSDFFLIPRIRRLKLEITIFKAKWRKLELKFNGCTITIIISTNFVFIF